MYRHYLRLGTGSRCRRVAFHLVSFHHPHPLVSSIRRNTNSTLLHNKRRSSGYVHLSVTKASSSSPRNNNITNINNVPQSPDQIPQGWKGFWSGIDTAAWLGTVGTAVAFLFTQEALLISGPILLPLLALYASKQRNKIEEVATRQLLQQQVSMALQQILQASEESFADITDDVAAVLEDMQKQEKKKAEPEKKVLQALQTKLSTVEQSMRSVENLSKELGEQSSAEREKTVKEMSSALGMLRRDLSADLRQATGDELAALGRVDARLAALEGALSGLEVAQSENLRRLTASMMSTLSDNEDALSNAVRAEVWNSLEPVRQLPQLLAAIPAIASPQMETMNEETVRSVLSDQLEEATKSILQQQQSFINELKSSPLTIAPQQWNQLGNKLMSMDEQLEVLITQQEERMKMKSGDDEGSGEEGRGLEKQLEEMKKEIIALLSSSLTTTSSSSTSSSSSSNRSADSSSSSSSDKELISIFLSSVVPQLEKALVDLRSEVQNAVQQSSTNNTTGSTATTLGASEVNIEWLVRLDRKMENAFTPVLNALHRLQESYLGIQKGIEEEEEERKNIDSNEVEKQSAYASMQRVLLSREDASTGTEEVPTLNTNKSTTSTSESTGLPIRDWLVSDDSLKSTNEEKNTSTASPVVSSLQNGDVSSSTTTNNASSSTTGTDRSGSLAPSQKTQDQIAFESALMMSNDSDTEETIRPLSSTSTSSSTSTGTAVVSGDNGDVSMPLPTFNEEEMGPQSMPVNTLGTIEMADRSISTTEPQANKDAPSATTPIPTPTIPTPPSTIGVIVGEGYDQVESQYDLGIEALRLGRQLALTPQYHDDAEISLKKATEYFSIEVASKTTSNNGIHDGTALKALGNCGNAFMALGKLKIEQSRLSSSDFEMKNQRESAQEMLVMAGRKYREVLQIDSMQFRALLNWGRALCLRAELAVEGGDMSTAHSLYTNAAEKFDAALDIEGSGSNGAEAVRLAGMALLSAATCVQDGKSYSRELLLEAEDYLKIAAGSGNRPEEAREKLRECQELIDSLDG